MDGTLDQAPQARTEPRPLALLNRSLFATIVLAAMIVAAAFWLGARNKSDDAWVSHSLEARAQLTRILSLVQSAETGQRGYLLTGRDIYLGPYQDAIEQLPPMLDRAKDLFSDNTQQEQALDELHKLITAKLDELHSTLDAYKSGHSEAALAVVDNDNGFRLMQQIQQSITAMQATEDSLLASRQSAAEKSAILLQAGVAIGFLLICGVGFLVTRFTRASFAALTTARDRLIASNEQLIEQVTRREAAESQLRQSQKMEALGQLTGGIAHDFNNMLGADAQQLENAIINVAVNARDAMPEGGKLTIETTNTHLDEAYCRQNPGVQPGQFAMIAISDTGVGMPPAVAARAFDPFFTTKATGKGTGLGLSQVYGFVKQSQGHIKVYSEPGAGTTVKIYLPRLIGEPQDVKREVIEPVRTGDRSEIILVVEDDSLMRRLAADALHELGYTVFEAESAATALATLDRVADIKLLFTDVVMPDINGKKLADEAVRRRPGLKVIFTTGYTANAVVHGGVLDQGVNFISKPFTLDQLAAKVRTVLDG
jgi:CHASE3 domain sensor protein/CheY-like chemotaxis protein